MPLAGEEFGAVHAAGFDADEDAARGRGRNGNVLELEDLGAAGGVHDDCAHCFGHGEEVLERGCCLFAWGEKGGSGQLRL